MMWATAACCAVLLAVVPPLTPTQRRQLAAANDGPAVDAGPLYPLLRNVRRWSSDARHDEAGARVPDYGALESQPGGRRGELFLVEGEFARSRRVKLTRSGPWGEAVIEWDLRVRRNPDKVAVVYLVSPKGRPPEPKVGRTVRVAARFYKLWPHPDRRGRRSFYPVFVGRWPKVIGGTAAANDGTARRLPVGVEILIPLLVVLVIGVVLLRHLLRSRTRREARRRGPAGRTTHARSPEGASAAAPRDAAAALARMDRRAGPPTSG